MPKDYEDVDDIESMDDEDLRGRIIQQFEEHGGIDPDLVDVRVEDGHVTLAGRVGTERELQEFEHVVTDVLGLSRITNEIVVDELVRETHSEAADEAVVERASAGPSSGGADRTSDTADHLLDDTAAEQFGTDDIPEAIERGYAYEPPREPIQEGTESRERH